MTRQPAPSEESEETEPELVHMTPERFAEINGWDRTCVEATARDGVSDEDYDRLSESDLTDEELLAWCRAQVAAREQALKAAQEEVES